jgi:fatty acid-binding protein DegV
LSKIAWIVAPSGNEEVDITPEEVYQRLEKEIPSTSLPDGATIQAIFDKIKEAGYEKVLAVTISSGNEVLGISFSKR